MAVVLPLRRIPAVSMMRKVCSGVCRNVSTESRVVPATGETIARSSPSSRFNNDDLPTLGRPTMARFNSRRSFFASLCVFASWRESRSTPSLAVGLLPRASSDARFQRSLLTSASSISPIRYRPGHTRDSIVAESISDSGTPPAVTSA